ncbi:MAG: hypothetical protein EOM69_04455 [Clostridia bacterium]|nr:hypothetical protein [Clostridia bacterium]
MKQKLLPLLFFLLFLSGCANLDDASTYDVVCGMTVWREGSHVQLALELADGQARTAVTGVGSSLHDALDDARIRRGHSVFLGHASAVVTTPADAYETAQYLIERRDARLDLRLLACEQEIARDISDSGKIDQLFDAVDLGARFARTCETPLFRFLEEFESEGIDPALTHVTAEHGVPVVQGCTVFAGGGSLYLSAPETLCLQLARNRFETGAVRISSDTILLDKGRSKLRAEVRNGQVCATLTVRLTADATEKYTAQVEAEVTNQLRTFFDRMRREGADPVGIGRYVERHFPDEWPNLRDHYLETLSVEVSVSVKASPHPRMKED